MTTISRFLMAALCAGALAACSGSPSDKATPTPFSQQDFNKNFLAIMAQTPTHFQDMLGEKQGSEGIIPIFSSKIALPGTTACTVKNTADDKAMVICNYGSYASLKDAKTAYLTIKKWAITAMPNSAASMEQNGDPDIPFRYIIRYKGAQAQAAAAKNDDTKQYDVGFVFNKP